MARQQSRRWSATFFSEEPPEWDPSWMSYLLAAQEICPETQRLHWQTYLETSRRLTLAGLKAKPGWETCHLEISRGSSTANQDYCLKTGTEIYVEYGEIFQQGTRADLQALGDQLIAGTTTVDEITLDQPHAHHIYGRTLDRIEDILNQRRTPRSSPPEVFWFWGPTGTGKTRRVFEEMSPDDHWVWTDDRGWWDTYRGQSDVVFDDFRGQVPFAFLLRLLDRYPVSVPRRGRAPMPFTATRIWITSCFQPELCYQSERVQDHVEQLLRRITRVIHFDRL